METCDLCGKEIPEGTGDEFIDRTTGEKFCLCDDCIAEGDYY
jgi:ribosomal protein L24E